MPSWRPARPRARSYSKDFEQLMKPADGVDISVEREPRPEDVRTLEQKLYDYNVEVTGIADGELLGVFLKTTDGILAGGAFGWTWGGTCHIRHLFVTAHLRRQGHGTRLMHAVEAEARARGCGQMLLETHDFQAPEFYRKLGFKLTSVVDRYPRGHQYLSFLKRLEG
jgi:GNAT superfamily N-acetyltransferase